MTNPKLQTKEKVIDIAVAKYAQKRDISYDRALCLMPLEKILSASLPEGTYELIL